MPVSTTPIDCTSAEGIAVAIRNLLPAGCDQFYPDSLIKLAESASCPGEAAAQAFEIMAAKASGQLNVKIGDTQITTTLLDNWLRMASQFRKNGLPGCGKSMPEPKFHKECKKNDLREGDFDNYRCGSCGTYYSNYDSCKACYNCECN